MSGGARGVRRQPALGAAVVQKGCAVGFAQDLDADRLAGLRPDLILTQDVCSVCSIDQAAVRRVADRLNPRPAVLSLDPATVEGVLDDMSRAPPSAYPH